MENASIAELLEKQGLPLIGEHLKEITSLPDLRQKLKEYNLALDSLLTDEYGYDEPMEFILLADYKEAIANFGAVL
jgi:hypothetical protein